jgi:hypothetical protein
MTERTSAAVRSELATVRQTMDTYRVWLADSLGDHTPADHAAQQARYIELSDQVAALQAELAALAAAVPADPFDGLA